MNQNQNLLALEENSDLVPTNKAANDKVNLAAINQEVTIKPLPPEIEKLVRKYLSRY